MLCDDEVREARSVGRGRSAGVADVVDVVLAVRVS